MSTISICLASLSTKFSIFITFIHSSKECGIGAIRILLAKFDLLSKCKFTNKCHNKILLISKGYTYIFYLYCCKCDSSEIYWRWSTQRIPIFIKLPIKWKVIWSIIHHSKNNSTSCTRNRAGKNCSWNTNIFYRHWSWCIVSIQVFIQD